MIVMMITDDYHYTIVVCLFNLVCKYKKYTRHTPFAQTETKFIIDLQSIPLLPLIKQKRIVLYSCVWLRLYIIPLCKVKRIQLAKAKAKGCTICIMWYFTMCVVNVNVRLYVFYNYGYSAHYVLWCFTCCQWFFELNLFGLMDIYKIHLTHTLAPSFKLILFSHTQSMVDFNTNNRNAFTYDGYQCSESLRYQSKYQHYAMFYLFIYSFVLTV